MINFSWDSAKARSNLKKHGVSFEEAKSVFYDDFAIQFYDDNSFDEDRFLLLGLSNQSRILVVVHCDEGNRERNAELFRPGKPPPRNGDTTMVTLNERPVRFFENEVTEESVRFKTKKACNNPIE